MKFVPFGDLIGKKIIGFRGLPTKQRFTNQIVVKLQYVLFDDGETIMELQEQCPFDYHDCSSTAREIRVYADKSLWERLNNKDIYADPDDLGSFLS